MGISFSRKQKMLNKSKKITLLGLLALCCIALAQDANAQFWRAERKPRKVNSLNKYPIKPTKPAEKKTAEKPKKKGVLEYPASVKKDRYRIDVLLPLYLDDLVEEGKVNFKGKVPDRAQSGLSFYEGVHLAVDTLTRMGYKTDIYVHDITAKGASLDGLIGLDSLKNTDLIIGFLSAQQVAQVAQYAARLKVNFVSAFSPSDAGIKDNPYFILVNPTLQSNCDMLVQSMLKKRTKEPLLLLKRETVSVDSAAYHFMLEASTLKDHRVLDCNKMPDSLRLVAHLDSMQTNFILMPIMDAQYADKIVTALHQYFPNYRMEIFGMPSWKSLCTNKKMMELGPNISIYLTQPYHFDALTPLTQNFSEAYKAKFEGRPNELNYRGYELVYWMTDLVNKYGAKFNLKTDDDEMAIFTRYSIKPKWDKEDQLYYLENKHLYLFRYQSGIISVQ